MHSGTFKRKAYEAKKVKYSEFTYVYQYSVS